jgi:hypothetical protein
VFVFITHEAAGASTPGIPHALYFQSGERFCKNSGKSRREIADAYLRLAHLENCLAV